MIKAIALIRTSTIQQEIDSQKEQILKLCYEDGLKEDEVIIVGKQGASAIKVDDAYIENMNRVYELLYTHPSIKTVYVWAIDRIGRTREHLSNFRETLLKKKVQLIIKTPYLRLLNEDGSENVGVGIAFSVFIEMAIQEMKQKVERFKRAKERNRKNGKFNGGPMLLYGYKVNEDGYYEVDEVDGQVVKEIFEEYATGKWSLNTLTTEMYKRGYRKKGKNKLPITTIRVALYNYKRYAGIDENYNYPQIISKELAYQVKERLEQNKRMQKSKKHTYLGFGIVYCKCGSRLKQNGTHYKCNAKFNKLGRLIGELPKCNLKENNVNCGILDGILWKVALDCYSIALDKLNKDKRKELNKELKILDKKANNLEKIIAGFKEKRKKLKTKYVLEDLSEDEIIILGNKLKQQEKKYKEELENIKLKQSKIKVTLSMGNDTKRDNEKKFLTMFDTEFFSTEKEMKNLVNKYIIKGTIGKYEGELNKYQHRNKRIEIVLETVYGTRTFIIFPAVRDKNKVYELYNGNEIEPFYYEEIIRNSKGFELEFKGYEE